MRDHLLYATSFCLLLQPSLYCNSAPTKHANEDIYEIAIRALLDSGLFSADNVFIQFPGEADPSDAFLSRFASLNRHFFKASQSTKTPNIDQQVILRGTSAPGVLVRLLELKFISPKKARVELSYEMHNLGTGSCTFVLQKGSKSWTIVQKSIGPQA